MDKKKQRILSIIIGLILASLLIYIGVRVLQQRASRASVPESFTAERIDSDTCRITAKTQTDEALLFRYGETTPTFYYRMEAANITPDADGTYIQEADVNNLGSGQITFLVENHEDVSTTCEPFTGSSDTPSDDTAPVGLQDTTGGQQTVPQPTAIPVVEEPVVEDPVVDEPVEVVSKEALTKAEADAYFESNPNNDVIDCANEFKEDYLSYIQVCNEAWRDSTATE